jgi:hypothetical protein
MPYIIARGAVRSYVHRGTAAAGAAAQKQKTGKAGDMGRLVKLVLMLVVLGLIGLSGYAYLGDLSPAQSTITQPVNLDAN